MASGTDSTPMKRRGSIATCNISRTYQQDSTYSFQCTSDAAPNRLPHPIGPPGCPARLPNTFPEYHLHRPTLFKFLLRYSC